jgi:hypothetical protein
LRKSRELRGKVRGRAYFAVDNRPPTGLIDEEEKLGARDVKVKRDELERAEKIKGRCFIARGTDPYLEKHEEQKS